MILLTIILTVTWLGLCGFFTYFLFYQDDELKLSKEALSFRIFILILCYSPINIILGLIMGGVTIYENLIVPKYKEFKENIEIRKERKQKIKLGIIKITPDDPYGEENWKE